MTPPLLMQIADDYSAMFNSCIPGANAAGIVSADRLADIDQEVHFILNQISRYAEVAGKFEGMPPIFVGLIHMMEAGGDFKEGLYNGDPLTARTVNVPRGRPLTGTPPFTWEFVAVDALQYEREAGDWRMIPETDWDNWSVAGMLYKLEAYNGWGSRVYHNTPTAYLWAGSNQYTQGKYVSDGVWSPTAVSDEDGAAVLLRRICMQHLITLPGAVV